VTSAPASTAGDLLAGRPAGPDSGESLIELLVAIVVIGIGVTALLGAWQIAVASSSLNANQSKAQAVVRSWAESISTVTDTGPYAYVPCAGAASIPAASGLPTGFTAVVSGVQYWTVSGWSVACPATDLGAERVSLKVTSPAGLYPGISQTLDVVRRRPCTTAAPC
jgi:Tfp pilus assembly protein PilV